MPTHYTISEDGSFFEPCDRVRALEKAIEFYAGRDADAEKVINTAEAFLEFLARDVADGLRNPIRKQDKRSDKT